MTGPVDIVVISTLGGVCIYLWTKQRAEKLKTEEAIPLLNDRESKLKEGERVLLEEKQKVDKLESVYKQKVKEVEAQKAELEKEKVALRDEKSKQQSLGEELTARTKKVETLEAKLKDDIQEFEKEKTVQSQNLEAQENELKAKAEALESSASEFEERLESREKELETKASELSSKADELESKEKALESKAEEIESKMIELESKEKELESKEAELQKAAEAKPAEEDAEAVVVETCEPVEEPQEPAPSDAEIRKKMIEEELDRLVKQTNETELSPEDPFDDDSIEALKKAAMTICYLKKYYDVMNDKFVFFPTVARTALDYRLMEEAEKHYFEEEDEYPADLSGGLRAVAFAIVDAEEDEDFDEEYMNALAQDVEL